MALPLHSLSPFFTGEPYPQFSRPLFVISQESSESSKSAISGDRSSTVKKPGSSGQGFGSEKKEKVKGKRERASIIRRSPVEKPVVLGGKREEEVKGQSENESAFLLAWLGLGGFILVEGIALAASGFLPEEWDKLFVKFLYPSFTPTVFVFVAGTVAYGVLKYLQNQDLQNPK